MTFPVARAAPSSFPESVSPALTLHPIGYIASTKQVKFDARHQPAEHERESSVLELLPDQNFEQALQDLAGFSRIWLVWWFHRNTTWRPLVLPPRGPEQRRGVFATRSPHRPNPLGITAVQLLAIDGRRLILGPCDLVDGTPVLDIKPYLPTVDAFPHERSGWNEAVEATYGQPPQFTVGFAALAVTQAEWLQTNWGIDFRPRLLELLARDPAPHRTRRIKARRNGTFVIGCGAWYAYFGVSGSIVTVLHLEPAFPHRFLTDPARPGIPDAAAQLAFLEIWPLQPSTGL